MEPCEVMLLVVVIDDAVTALRVVLPLTFNVPPATTLFATLSVEADVLAKVVFPLTVSVEAVVEARIVLPVTVSALESISPFMSKIFVWESQLPERCSMLVGTLIVFAAVVSYEQIGRAHV